MTLQNTQMSVFMAALAVILFIGLAPWQRLQERLSVPLVGFLGFAIMEGLAALYSHFGHLAAQEYAKFLASFSLATIFLVRFDRKHIRALLWGITASCTVIAFICVDMGSWQGIFQPFNSLMNAFGMDFSTSIDVAGGIRFNGLYRDANITGAILALSMLISIYLAHTSEKPWQRGLGCIFLGINGVSFFLAMSRGAIAFFCIATLVYLAAERNNRTGLFFLLIAATVSTLLTGGYIMTHLQDNLLLPDVLCLAGGILCAGLDFYVTNRIAWQMERHKRIFAIVCAFMVVLSGVISATALRITDAYTYTQEYESFQRSAVLTGGETYTLDCTWEGEKDIILWIYSQSTEQSRVGQSDTLYYGSEKKVTITVLENSPNVFFQFTGFPGSVLRSATLSNGISLPLHYKLLPEAIAFRLHDGVFRGTNFLQRVQYNIDGWAIFKQSPWIGHGLGSSEELVSTVQPFYYESKYLHNHILQVLVEMGVVGCVFFLALLLGTLWLLLRRLWKAPDSLAACLLGCWVMMNTHSLMEISFSIRAYQCIAFSILSLIIILYTGQSEKEPQTEEKPAQSWANKKKNTSQTIPWRKWGGAALLGCFCVYLATFGILFQRHREVMAASSRLSAGTPEELLQTIQDLVEKDVFDHAALQLTYISEALKHGDDFYNAKAYQYVDDLRSTKSYSACTGLVRYFYLPLKSYQELFSCYREGIVQEASSTDVWNGAFDFYRTDLLPAMKADDMEIFIQGVLDTKADLDAYNDSGRLEEIHLSAANQTLLDNISQAREEGLTNEALYTYLLTPTGQA